MYGDSGCRSREEIFALPFLLSLFGVCVYTFLGELVSNLLNLNSPNSSSAIRSEAASIDVKAGSCKDVKRSREVLFQAGVEVEGDIRDLGVIGHGNSGHNSFMCLRRAGAPS